MPARDYDPRKFVRTVKRRLAMVAAAVFGAFWFLAAGHSVGVTATQSSLEAPAAQQGQIPGGVQSDPAGTQSSGGSFRTSGRHARASIVYGGSGVAVLGSGSS